MMLPLSVTEVTNSPEAGSAASVATMMVSPVLTLDTRFAETKSFVVPALELLAFWLHVNPLPKLVLEQADPVPPLALDLNATVLASQLTGPPSVNDAP